MVIYCTPWCPDCRQARAWLASQGIQYTEVDISKNREAAAQVRQWAGGKEITPCFNIKGTIIVNYDKPKVEKALGLA